MKSEDRAAQFVLLLRGINVGGHNKVPMPELRSLLRDAGCANVRSYINSGNLLFDLPADISDVNDIVRGIIDRNYSKDIAMLVMTGEQYLTEASMLPQWWYEPMARKDVLFLMDDADPGYVKERIESMPLADEAVAFGERAVFWGKRTESEFLKTAYHKLLIKESFYPLITIRNGRTFDKIKDMLTEYK